MIIEVMETGTNGTGSGKNLSSVLKIPGQHIYDWFSAGMIIEIIRTRWDGNEERQKPFSSAQDP